MSINLTKGQRVDIDLQQFGIGLGWDPSDQASSEDYDLDASAFILGENGKLLSSAHFVFYNNLASPGQAVTSTGDNRTGDGDGDDETILADLSRIEPSASEIIFAVTIHEFEERRQNFGQVRNSFIRIYDAAMGEEICKYELDEDFSTESAVEFGRLYKRSGKWKFEATGRGYQGGLQTLLDRYV
jgi:tellurium resistance protein TerD